MQNSEHMNLIDSDNEIDHEPENIEFKVDEPENIEFKVDDSEFAEFDNKLEQPSEMIMNQETLISENDTPVVKKATKKQPKRKFGEFLML